MSLIERVKNFKERQARAEAERQAKEAKLRYEAMLRAQTDNEYNEWSDYHARKSIIDKRMELEAKLLPLLEFVEARYNLEQIRRLWQAGRVDKSPAGIEISGLGDGVALGLRHTFKDVAKVTGSIERRVDYDGATETHSWVVGREVYDRQSALVVAINMKGDTPHVTTIYKESGSNGVVSIDRANKGYEFTSLSSKYPHCPSPFFIRTDAIDVTNKTASIRTLENQLYDFYTNGGIESPHSQEMKALKRFRGS